MGCTGSTVVETDELDQLHRSTALQCDIKPHYFVLEIGFGKGHGLQEVLNLIRGGPGRLVGTETSQNILDQVTDQLQDNITTGTLELELCAPETLTFIQNMFDCAYNVNGFYYWEDIGMTLSEIYRVLRPGCLFLTCVHKTNNNHKTNNKPKEKQQTEMQNSNATIQEYTEALKKNGFVKIKTIEHRNAHSGVKYQTVQAFTRRRK